MIVEIQQEMFKFNNCMAEIVFEQPLMTQWKKRQLKSEISEVSGHRYALDGSNLTDLLGVVVVVRPLYSDKNLKIRNSNFHSERAKFKQVYMM